MTFAVIAAHRRCTKDIEIETFRRAHPGPGNSVFGYIVIDTYFVRRPNLIDDPIFVQSHPHMSNDAMR